MNFLCWSQMGGKRMLNFPLISCMGREFALKFLLPSSCGNKGVTKINFEHQDS